MRQPPWQQNLLIAPAVPRRDGGHRVLTGQSAGERYSVVTACRGARRRALDRRARFRGKVVDAFRNCVGRGGGAVSEPRRRSGTTASFRASRGREVEPVTMRTSMKKIIIRLETNLYQINLR